MGHSNHHLQNVVCQCQIWHPNVHHWNQFKSYINIFLTMSFPNEIRKPILTGDCRLWIVFLPHYFLHVLGHQKLSACPGFAEPWNKPRASVGTWSDLTKHWRSLEITGAVIGPSSASKPSFPNFLCASNFRIHQAFYQILPSTGHYVSRTWKGKKVFYGDLTKTEPY